MLTIASRSAPNAGSEDFLHRENMKLLRTISIIRAPANLLPLMWVNSCGRGLWQAFERPAFGLQKERYSTSTRSRAGSLLIEYQMV